MKRATTPQMAVAADVRRSMSSFEKTSTAKAPARTQRRFLVFAVVRHTRAGDHFMSLRPAASEDDRARALEEAEELADHAASLYGHGSASVFRGVLLLSRKPEKP